MNTITNNKGLRMKNQKLFLLYFFSVAILHLISCKPDKKDEGFTLRIRIKEDVDCLHPILSRSSLATQIEWFIMPPMFEYSLDKIKLEPVMTTNLPQLTSSDDSVSIFEYDIHPDAKWDDGSPVQVSDFVFTVKASLNPFLKNTTWRGLLRNINDIVKLVDRPQHLVALIQKNYLLSSEICGNINVYQQKMYDPNSIMRKYSIRDLIAKDSTAWTNEERNELQKFADDFQNADMCKSKISGAGPYKLVSWDAGSKIVLEKKKNWWGEKLASTNSMLRAIPDRIEYVIMPDEAAAILALKDGSIDLLTDISPKQFDALKKDTTSNVKLQFFAIDGISQYSCLDLNTRKPGLSDKAVRKALAHLIDINSFIKNVMQGMAEPIVGPIHPSLDFYNKNLKPIQFDPEKATTELTNAGWKDTNKDGILDKVVDGKNVKLSFTMLVTSEVGKKLGLLFQEEAKKVGIEIKPEIKDWSLILKDMTDRTFDMATVMQAQAPSLWDPYQSWHSSSAKTGGKNHCGFATSETDSLIHIIRTAPSEEIRNDAYSKFQEVLYNEQPQIFLFSPKQRIIASSRIKLETSSRRPGYMENTIQLAK
jgi:peptide/nickel transport system substrate-binding protein